jgi:hypothetical protein
MFMILLGLAPQTLQKHGNKCSVTSFAWMQQLAEAEISEEKACKAKGVLYDV